MGPPKQIQVSHSEGADLYELKSGLTGQQLYDQVIATLQMEALDLYSFQYKDSKDHDAYLKLDKKITGQDINKKE